MLLGYVLLTLAMTLPLVRDFVRAIPGDGFDGWQNYWNLWWVKTALLEAHMSPFFTDQLYYPTGVGLLFHTLNPFNGLWALPVQAAAGLLPAYNAVVLFSFALGGFGAYLLARHVLGPARSRWPAFIAGTIFTFSPFHVAHLLGHMQVISLEWIPFFALYLLRAVDGMKGEGRPATDDRRPAARQYPTPNTQYPVKNILLAAFFLVLVALCDWYYVLYCLIFTVVAVVWAAWRAHAAAGRRSAVDLWRMLAIPAAIWPIWAIALSPLLVPMVREAQQFRFMVPDPAQSRTLSADLLAFVTPQEFHPLWGRWAQERARVFTSTVSEHSVFVGYAALALAALGAWKTRRRIGPWPLIAVVFGLLALGPVLHIGGQTALLPGSREIPLPYGWLARVIPFMEITRSVSRFDALVMLAVAMLAAVGAEWLCRHQTRFSGFRSVSAADFNRRTRRRGSRGCALAALALIVFEFWPAPYPMSLPDTPAWYAALAADPRPGAVLNLPMNWDRPGYLLYQTVHGKPLTVAYISRDDPRTLTERAPVLQHLRHLGPDIIAFDLTGQGQQVLVDLGVRWVVLDRYKMPGGREREYTEAAAAQIFAGQAPVHRDERLTVYEVAAPPVARPYLILGEGWEAFDKGAGTRAFADRASVAIHAPAAGRVRLRITLAPGSAALAETERLLAVQPGVNDLLLSAAMPGGRVIVSGLAVEAAE